MRHSSTFPNWGSSRCSCGRYVRADHHRRHSPRRRKRRMGGLGSVCWGRTSVSFGDCIALLKCLASFTHLEAAFCPLNGARILRHRVRHGLSRWPISLKTWGTCRAWSRTGRVCCRPRRRWSDRHHSPTGRTLRSADHRRASAIQRERATIRGDLTIVPKSASGLLPPLGSDGDDDADDGEDE